MNRLVCLTVSTFHLPCAFYLNIFLRKHFPIQQNANKFDQMQVGDSKADHLRSSIMENSSALEASLRSTNNNAQNSNSGNCVVSSLHRAFMPYSQATADHKQLAFPHQLSSSMADIAAAAAAAGSNAAANLLIDDHDMLPNLWSSSQQQSGNLLC